MAAKDQLSFGPMEVPTRVRATGSSDTSRVPTRDGLELLIGGAAGSGCQEKEIWRSLDLPDHSYWGKVKTGDKPEPRIRKLTKLPLTAQKAMVKLWAAQLGLHVSDADARTIAIADLAAAAAKALKELAS